jgi:hypothetical protein
MNAVWVAAMPWVLTSVALAATPGLSQEDQAAAFQAAGFQRQGGQWRQCDDPGTASYAPGAIERVVDLNGDGRPEVLISEGSVFCHGMTGLGYSLVSQQADGGWKLLDRGTGIPTFLATRGTNGWQDIEVGGPGFCFPVLRWNGREYALQRHQYEGKNCQP